MTRHHQRLKYPEYGREQILRDFAGHAMTVVRDDGVHRHLKFRAAETSTYWFEVVTWPGVLVIHGDCGTFAFRRLTDMFEFFRGGNGQSKINPSYWGEKLIAVDKPDGYREYSEGKGRDALASAMRSLREHGADNEVLRDLRQDAIIDENEHELFRTVMGWHFRDVDTNPHRGWRVDAFHEHNVMDYTFRFIWNCHAIVWAIEQYDAAKQPAHSEATT